MENLRLSFQGIWSHKLRSFLTMLGIIIGIAAIIAIVSTIKGTNEQIKENLVGSGDNLVKVQIYNGDWEYVSGNSESLSASIPMINDEIREYISGFDEVKSVAAYRTGYLNSGIYNGTKSLEGGMIYGIDQNYLSTVGYHLTSGRLFTKKDITEYRKNMILDSAAAKSLFDGDDPIGKGVEYMGEVYTVIGIVDMSNEFAPKVENINDWYTYYYQDAAGKVFVCDSVWPMIFGFDEPYNVVVRASSTEAMTDAGKKTADYLNGMIVSTDDSGSESEDGPKVKYKSENLLEKAKSLQELSNSTSKQLVWIAGISLIVGGIGVMNIMLVSVTERTREIGLKKALGARKKVILGQFLCEAAVLTSLGGILGVGAGIGLAYIVSDVAQVPVAISGSAILISVVFSMVIGIIFGFIPSVKAANLNPIDALRYE